jgi:Fur family ferric uptake transcriptional regulator
MNRSTQFRQALSEGGYRLTRQRQVILEVLEESDAHLDAGEIYELVRARDARIGMATVYRTLALLTSLGLVQEHRLGEEHSHFETVQEALHYLVQEHRLGEEHSHFETVQEALHYHFTCRNCGRVIEFEAPQVMEVIQALSDRERLKVEDVHLFISGRCAGCCEAEGTGA